MKRLVVLRGCPGSGKSYTADQLKAECDGTVVICSADDYFLDSTGQYKFNPQRLHLAHTYCQGKAEGAMEAQANLVIIANTNIKRKDYKPYVKMAGKYGYDVEEVVVGKLDAESLDLYAARNVHGVSKETIYKMAERWES
jgi:predicted kinase